MNVYLIVGVACLVAGGFGGYFLGNKAVSEYKKAAAVVGITFQKIEGKLTAIRKAL